MRPPRIAILVLFFVACLFLLCRSIAAVARPPPVITTPASSQSKSGLKSLFSFSTPFSLFPPNAIITIADDNSTSFAARPAAFGPPLPTKGLNGQLWIGSGFTEEALQDGGESDGGEFGCSDVPGFDGSTINPLLKASSKKADQNSKSGGSGGKIKGQKRDSSLKGPMVDRISTSGTDSKPKAKTVDDGTDDYLHERLQSSPSSQTDAGLSSSGHADIQSIQEGAEIAGKIVLLSRGGCGFLEKVKWAQRRGAIALIVGDNQRGGPLIQMYARGDTSNVSIPSIFTSRTTAYLLSSLMQPGSFIEDIIDENGKPSYQVQHPDKSRRNRKAKVQTTTTIETPKATDVNKPNAPATKKTVGTRAGDSTSADAQSPGWFSRIFSWGSSSAVGDRSRPPSSGRLDWVLVEDFSDSQDKIIKNSLEQASKSNSKSSTKSKSDKASGDGFKIGVEDWRDPDLVGSADQKDGSDGSLKGREKTSDSKSKSDSGKTDSKKAKDPNGPKGGSITPGSGEYFPNDPAKGKALANSKSDKLTSESEGGLLSKLFGDQNGADAFKAKAPAPIHTPIVEEPVPGDGDAPPEREGLWVVITPSSGASPFFDTLLVLVISPLITLTVVYALLILRARIRRRRWRAPKSVVERLPVRTYHTVAASTPSQSPRFPRSPSPAPPSPTTPLLQSQHSSSRSRPRSRTTTGVAADLLQASQSLQVPQSPPHEKPSQWKKYMGRQVECVVCLEEYVDGVSQVMSLPCGHEFHVECM
jgi:hypothetical protein